MASVDAAFGSLALAPGQEESAFRGQVNPFKRFFGKNDGGSPALRRPSSSDDHGNAGRLMNDSVERQRGLSVGFTNTFDSYTVMLGGRLPLATPRRPWPALTADVGVVFPSDGPVLDAELLASYEIDTQVDLFGGAAWLADGSGEHQTDWLFGLQLQLGRIRFRGAYRRSGTLNNDQADFRIQYRLLEIGDRECRARRRSARDASVPSRSIALVCEKRPCALETTLHEDRGRHVHCEFCRTQDS